MKVYVLTWLHGWEDTDVVGVFSTREQAEQVGKRLEASSAGQWQSGYTVEEFELDVADTRDE